MKSSWTEAITGDTFRGTPRGSLRKTCGKMPKAISGGILEILKKMIFENLERFSGGTFGLITKEQW